MTWFTADAESVDLDSVGVEPIELETSAAQTYTESVLSKLEAKIAHAYVHDAVAVDVIWKQPSLGVDPEKRFETNVWEEDPPEHPEELSDRNTSYIERYDLTSVSNDEFIDALAQSFARKR